MASTVDPDQTPRLVTSDLGLHCVLRHYHIYRKYWNTFTQGRTQEDFWGGGAGGGGGGSIFKHITILTLRVPTDWPEQTLLTQIKLDAAERGIWSATHPAILHTFTGSKMDSLKRSFRKSVLFIKFIQIFPMKMKFWVKVGFDWIPQAYEQAPVYSLP